MARDDVLEPIRTRAYILWEQAGRPEGGDLEFWERARQEIEAEQAAAAQPAELNSSQLNAPQRNAITKD